MRMSALSAYSNINQMIQTVCSRTVWAVADAACLFPKSRSQCRGNIPHTMRHCNI